jgi:hypothetical protein
MPKVRGWQARKRLPKRRKRRHFSRSSRLLLLRLRGQYCPPKICIKGRAERMINLIKGWLYNGDVEPLGLSIHQSILNSIIIGTQWRWSRAQLYWNEPSFGCILLLLPGNSRVVPRCRRNLDYRLHLPYYIFL